MLLGASIFVHRIPRRPDGSPDGVPTILLKKCSGLLSKTIALLWKQSLREGVVPESLKFGTVTAVFKGGDKSLPKNYRPITLSSHISKVFERILIKKITKYIEEVGLYNPGQHGFRKGRSTTSQLLEHYQQILEIMEDERSADVIYLDFAKAFDKVSHIIL